MKTNSINSFQVSQHDSVLNPASLKRSNSSSLYLKDVEVIPADPQLNKIKNYPKAWHLLTLGIPRLFEALSLFFDGIIHREKVGKPLAVRFTRGHLTKEEEIQLNKFQSLQERSDEASLNIYEVNKATQLVMELTQACEKAKIDKNNEAVVLCQAKLRPLCALIEKNKRAKFGAAKFNEEDWKILDLIKFELLKEGLDELTLTFNSEWFRNYNVSERLGRYGINYHEAVIAEVLALTLAYIEGIDGASINLPVFDNATNKYKSIPFSIKKTALGDSLPCYILESIDATISPWFVIRGTQRYTTLSSEGKEYREGSFESILADVLDHECISRHLINKALVRRPIVKEDGRLCQRESLGDNFRRWKQQGKKVLLSGHSLGGTLVNALTVEFFDDIKAGYSFSGTGVSNELASQWETIGKTKDIFKSNFPNKLVNFDHEGDIVPAGGRKLIGLHLAIETLVGASKGIYQSHIRGHLNRDFQIQKVNLLKENCKLARSFCERIRIIVGACLRFLLTLFSGSYLPDWWKNRKVYMDTAGFYRRMHLALTVT